MKTLYIFLTRSGTLLSNLVYHLTGAQYTHVSLAFDEDLSTLYSSTRKIVISKNPIYSESITKAAAPFFRPAALIFIENISFSPLIVFFTCKKTFPDKTGNTPVLLIQSRPVIFSSFCA